MKKTGITLIVAFMLIGCGAKKKTARKESNRFVVEEKGTYLLPEDTGRFVTIPIHSVPDYIATFAAFAQHEMETYGIPASITLAQGMLESGIGLGPLAVKSNNHFGIKCHNGWEGAVVSHDDDANGECFRKYNHPLYSFRDHSIFLSSRVRYASLFQLERDDYKGWAKGLKKAGYATDPKYADKLISFIERYNLQRFDSRKKRTLVANDIPASGERSGPVNYKIHRVVKGDTLYSLSQRYFVPIEEIMELNNMGTSLISIGQELKIREKDE